MTLTLQITVLFLMGVFAVSEIAKAAEVALPNPTASGERAMSVDRIAFGRSARIVAAGADLATVLLLGIKPLAGCGLAIVVLAAYSALLAKLPPEEDCGCFGDVAQFSNRTAIWRNGILGSIALAALLIGLGRDLNEGLYAQRSIGPAVVLVTTFFLLSRVLFDERSVVHFTRWRMPDQLATRR